MKILVTGASGFVGRECVVTLRKAGHEVVAGSRHGCGVNAMAYGDLVSADWQLAGQGFDAIVHLAARVHRMRDEAPDPLAAFRAVNRDATLRLANAARDAGVRRFVFMSSVKAAVDTTGTEPIAEAVICNPTTDYGISKMEAEEALRALGASGFDVVILRPPMVYGAEARGNFHDLIKLIATGVPLPLASIDNRRSFIGIRNLASVVEAALKSPVGTFFVSDGLPIGVPRLIEELARAMRRPDRLFPFPIAMLRTLCAIAGQRSRLTKLTESLAISNDAFRQATGWSPPYSMAEELARLIQ